MLKNKKVLVTGQQDLLAAILRIFGGSRGSCYGDGTNELNGHLGWLEPLAKAKQIKVCYADIQRYARGGGCCC